jgi:FMN phosphatase YigB (HAD superfamily)
MQKRIGVICDLDDTLIGTSTAYYRALVKAMDYTLKKVANPYHVEPSLMLEVYREVDCEIRTKIKNGQTKNLYPLSKLKNYEATSFPPTLAEAFVTWCLRGGFLPTNEDVRAIFEIGQSILTYKYEFVPYAKALLHYLDRKPDTKLFLITRGSSMLQTPKLTAPEFNRFERMIIMPYNDSKLGYIKKLQEEYDNIDNWYMVGDDANVDINVALALRMCAVWVTKGVCDAFRGDIIDIGDSRSYLFEVIDLEEALRLFRSFYEADHVITKTKAMFYDEV